MSRRPAIVGIVVLLPEGAPQGDAFFVGRDQGDQSPTRAIRGAARFEHPQRLSADLVNGSASSEEIRGIEERLAKALVLRAETTTMRGRRGP